MIRPVALIAAAILLSRPGMAPSEAKRYATVLQEEAREHDFDPLTGVAIIHHESNWYPEVISDNGEDFGLGQIRARFVGACRKDEDPVNNPSEECQAEKKRLLDPLENIRLMATIITRNRELCREKVGSALFHQWLASYQGRNFPKANRWCKPGTQTWNVINYRKHLISELLSKRVGKPKAVGPKATGAKPKAAAKSKSPGKAAAKQQPKKRSRKVAAKPPSSSRKTASRK